MSTKDAFFMCLDLYNSKALWKTFSLQTPLSFNAKQHDNYHKIWKHHVFIKPHFVSKLLVGYSLHNQKAYCCCNVKLCTFKKLGFPPISSNWILGDMKHYIYPLKLFFSSLATKISPFFESSKFCILCCHGDKDNKNNMDCTQGWQSFCMHNHLPIVEIKPNIVHYNARLGGVFCDVGCMVYK